MCTSVDSGEVEKNQAFLRWFEAKGGSVHTDVSLTSFSSMGRGAIALQAIKVYYYLWLPLYAILMHEFFP
jgi:hypothetical protein